MKCFRLQDKGHSHVNRGKVEAREGRAIGAPSEDSRDAIVLLTCRPYTAVATIGPESLSALPSSRSASAVSTCGTDSGSERSSEGDRSAREIK